MSAFVFELFVAIVMLFIVGVLVVFRLPELKQCWKVHRRVKFYFCLTVIAIVVDLCIAIGGILFLTWDKDPRLVQVTWSMRQVHIALDTLVLYGTLSIPSTRMEVSDAASSDTASRGRRGLSGERRSSSGERRSTSNDRRVKRLQHKLSGTGSQKHSKVHTSTNMASPAV